MSLLPVLPDEAADGEVARMYAADRERVGYLPNYTRAFWTRPQVYAAWRQLIGVITSSMDIRLFEVATLGAARALRSTYCSLAHGQILASRYLQDGEILGLLTVVDTGAERPAGVDPRDAAVVAFSAKVARHAVDVDESDVASLRAVGLSDEEIFGVILAVSARCFFSTVLDATDTRADAALADLGPALVAALSVGRPIQPPPT